MSVWPKNSPWIGLKRRKRSSRWEVFGEKVFLQISQNSQENTCARVSFPWFFAKFLIIAFIIEHLWWLLLNFWNSFQLCYKRTQVQVFSYEFCKTSENSFSVKQSKTISSDLYCSNLVYLLVSSITVGKVYFYRTYWKGWGITQFFKIQIYGIITLSHHFEKEIYQYVKIKQLAKKNIFFKNTS